MKLEPERITAAALLPGFGANPISLPAPARHDDVIRHMVNVRGFRTVDIARCEQGFLTSKGRFVGREQAYYIAERAGQLTGHVPMAGLLFSENVW